MSDRSGRFGCKSEWWACAACGAATGSLLLLFNILYAAEEFQSAHTWLCRASLSLFVRHIIMGWILLCRWSEAGTGFCFSWHSKYSEPSQGLEGTRLWLTRFSLLLPAGYWLQSRRCVCVCDPCTPCFFFFSYKPSYYTCSFQCSDSLFCFLGYATCSWSCCRSEILLLPYYLQHQ